MEDEPFEYSTVSVRCRFLDPVELDAEVVVDMMDATADNLTGRLKYFKRC